MLRLTVVVKNLLIINGLFFLAKVAMPEFMNENFALFYPWSDAFKPHQLVSHMFMHGDLSHIFGNMFALFMFGPLLEDRFGSKRFLIFYMVTGLGAAGLHLASAYLESYPIVQAADFKVLEIVREQGLDALLHGKNFTDDTLATVNLAMNTPTVGASGAVFGILMGFGMLFPEYRVMLLFPPIPLKARQLVTVYAVIEIFLMIQNNPGDNVAHFAHVGGMLFAFLIIRFWRNRALL